MQKSELKTYYRHNLANHAFNKPLTKGSAPPKQAAIHELPKNNFNIIIPNGYMGAPKPVATQETRANNHVAPKNAKVIFEPTQSVDFKQLYRQGSNSDSTPRNGEKSPARLQLPDFNAPINNFGDLDLEIMTKKTTSEAKSSKSTYDPMDVFSSLPNPTLNSSNSHQPQTQNNFGDKYNNIDYLGNQGDTHGGKLELF